MGHMHGMAESLKQLHCLKRLAERTMVHSGSRRLVANTAARVIQQAAGETPTSSTPKVVHKLKVCVVLHTSRKPDVVHCRPAECV